MTGAGTALAQAQQVPILFVHGNAENAALWQTTIWRFESNGWNPFRLFAIDFAYPVARNDDAKEQPNRSSSADQMAALSKAVDTILFQTKRKQLILIGSGRGGLTIRNYLQNGKGASKAARVVLAGAMNHGVLYSNGTLVGSEFNGASPFLAGLNAIPGEVVPGIRYMTLRSDRMDKYAQPDGRSIGLPSLDTQVGFDGPALAGALNIVLPGLDHRELASHPQAFNEMYKMATGRLPRTLEIKPVIQPVLDGMVSGFADTVPTNVPIAGAEIEVFEVSAVTGERIGKARHKKKTGADGRWGPFKASPTAFYEFVLTVPGYPVTHIYRSPFPRSSKIVHLRPAMLTDADQGAGSIVTISRPRGYLATGRNVFAIDGVVPPGIAAGVPAAGTATLRLPAGPVRAIRAVLDEERLTVRNWPAAENHVVIAEFTH